MTDKKEISFTVKQLIALIPLFVAIGTGVGWFGKPSENDLPRAAAIKAAIDSVNSENKVKYILDSIGRISRNVERITISMDKMQDSINAISHRQLLLLSSECNTKSSFFAMENK